MVRDHCPLRPTLEQLENRDVPAAFTDYPVIPEISSEMKAHLHDVYVRGQALGQTANTFAKIGDSITSNLTSQSFTPLGNIGYNPIVNGLSQPDLLNTLAVYQAPVTAFENSWSRNSSSAIPGFRVQDMLSLAPGELAAVHPAISLILIGTNNALLGDLGAFQSQLGQLVEYHLARGVIPVLSTIPPTTYQGNAHQTAVNQVNQAIVDVAEQYDVPVWNFWKAMVPLPFAGLADGVHPNTAPQGGGYFGPGGLGFGYNVRNFTALEVLTKIRKVVFEDAPPDRFSYPPSQPWSAVLPEQSIMAMGAVAGSAPLVVLRDANTGAVIHQFLAFEPAFGGGVRVAVADVNGDHISDVITAAGPGGGPVVRAYSGVDGTELFSFYAFEPTFTGGVTIAVGDVNGDGIAEVVVGAGVGGGPRVRVFDPMTQTIVSEFFAFEESFRGGVNVAVGHFGEELPTAVVATPGAGGSGRVAVLDPSTGGMIASYFVFDPNERQGAELATGDVNGDGIDDLIVSNSAGIVRTVRAQSGDIIGEFSLGFGTGNTRIGVLPGEPGQILVNRRGDPAGFLSVFDGNGTRLRSFDDPIDDFVPTGVYVDA
ncbi:MAG: SGNH/GDSL hydrolase family protein [Bacteroidales bacterium]|nr:SGNH/GDSL hydrolase family protein [Bacteroidales bacterium]